MGMLIYLRSEDAFGTCPTCNKTDGYINVGRGHWFVCHEHRVKWFVGSNLFDSWKCETVEEQKGRYDELGLGSYRELGLAELASR